MTKTNFNSCFRILSHNVQTESPARISSCVQPAACEPGGRDSPHPLLATGLPQYFPQDDHARVGAPETSGNTAAPGLVPNSPALITVLIFLLLHSFACSRS